MIIEIKKTLPILLCSLLAMPCYGSESDFEAAFELQEQRFEARQAEREARFDEQVTNQEQLWTRVEADEKAKWTRLEKAVKIKWDHYLKSSQKVWVDYTDDHNQVSATDFEKGTVTVAAVLPIGSSTEQQQQAVVEKLTAVLEKKDAGGVSVVGDLVSEVVLKDPQSMAEKIKQERITGGDGVSRVKVSVTLEMLPNHVSKQAQKVLPKVVKEATKQGVEPALVMAVIHSESAFNPMARSHIPAYGLMQIVPRWAGKEAYTHLYGEERLLSADYLYNPDNNIELGITYLALLFQRYFKDINDYDKQRYVVICAYNWGPTAVRKRLLPTLNVEGLASQALFNQLLTSVPKETHHYLQRVEKRRESYLGEITESI